MSKVSTEVDSESVSVYCIEHIPKIENSIIYPLARSKNSAVMLMKYLCILPFSGRKHTLYACSFKKQPELHASVPSQLKDVTVFLTPVKYCKHPGGALKWAYKYKYNTIYTHNTYINVLKTIQVFTLYLIELQHGICETLICKIKSMN